MRLPVGRSLDTGTWLEKPSPAPLKGYVSALALSGNRSTRNFWWHLLTNAGAKVIDSEDIVALSKTTSVNIYI